MRAILKKGALALTILALAGLVGCQAATSNDKTYGPTISLLGPQTVHLAVGDSFTDGGAVASDLTDGDLTKSIKTAVVVTDGVTGAVKAAPPSTVVLVNTGYPGAYTMTYAVSNSSGKAVSTTRTVVVGYDPKNGGFETGDLSGWTGINADVANPVFENKAVGSELTFWNEQIPFNKDGNFFFNTWDSTGGEGKTGTLQSSSFVLGGSGWVSFKLGGGSSAGTAPAAAGVFPNVVQVWVVGAAATATAVAIPDQLVAEYGNTAFNDANFPNVNKGSWANMHTFAADLSKYKGKTVYFEVVKQSTTGWGVMMLDSFTGYYASAPVVTAPATGQPRFNDTVKAVSQINGGALPDLPAGL